jgi:predicted amidohydrolase YtcJ
MEHQHSHHHACICSCNSPIVTILKDKIFSAENLEKISAFEPEAKPSLASPKPVVYTGGAIRPMINGEATIVPAIGFADGIVIASGSLADVKAAMDKKYKAKYTVTTLSDGQALLPGLFEPHIHTAFSGLTAAWVDVSPYDRQNLIGAGYTTDYIKGKLNDALKLHPNETLLAIGLDPALIFPYQCGSFHEINKGFLDGLNAKVSILVQSASGHTIYANTRALETTFNFPLNKKLRAAYNNSVTAYIADTDGLLQEEVGMTPAIEAHWEAVLRTTLPFNKNLTAFFEQANSRGVTSMYDALFNPEYLKLIGQYRLGHHLPVRLGGAKYCESIESANKLDSYQQPAAYSDIYFGHVKIVSDGSNQGLTGRQYDAYVCDDTNHGIFNFEGSAYEQLVNEVMVKKGWPVMSHANGDEAIEKTISVFENALANYKGPQLRNRIEHCSLLSAAGIDAMAKNNISPSFLIGHVGYWGDAFKNVIFKDQRQHGVTDGPLKADMLDLCKSAINKNIRISLHSDHTVSPVGPLRMMEQAITRVMEAKAAPDNILNPAEKLSAEEALKAVTYDAAWQCYADQWAGSLSNGHFADYIILEQDPLTMPEDQISMNMRNIKVEGTWLGGVQVYSKKA